MKARIAGYDVVVQWNHVLIALAALLGVAIVNVAISLAVSYALSGQAYGDMFVRISGLVRILVSLILAPVLAWVFLRTAKKKDEGASFSRSMAAAYFVVSLVVSIVTTVLALATYLADVLPKILLSEIFGFLDTIAVAALGAVLVFLWMLFFLKTDRKRMGTAAIYGAGFAGIFTLGEFFVRFILEYSTGQVYTPNLDYATAVALAGNAILAFIVLYHAGGRKIGPGATIFSGLFLAGPVIMVFSGVVAGPETYVTGDLVYLAEHIAKLALLYLIIRNWKDTI